MKIEGNVSLFFQVKSGVKLGCILAPIFFNTCIGWIIGETVGEVDCGISLGEATITNLDFADDVVVFAEMLEVLFHPLDK